MDKDADLMELTISPSNTGNNIKDLSSDYEKFNKMYGFRKFNPVYLYLFAGILSLIWTGIIAYYSNNTVYNWTSLFKMMPHEFGGFLSGIVIPIAFIWMIVLYIDRTINSNYEHKVIYPFLQSIIDPHGDTSVITNVITKKITTETDELKKTIDKLIEYSDKINDIHDNVEIKIKTSMQFMKEHEESIKDINTNLSNSYEKIDNKAKDILNLISSNITLLLDTTNSAEEKTDNITEHLFNETKKLESLISTTSKVIENMSLMIDSNMDHITNSTNNALNAVNITNDTFNKIGESFINSVNVVDMKVNNILSNISVNMSEVLNKSAISAERINNIISEFNKNINSIENISKENKHITESAAFKFKELSDALMMGIREQVENIEKYSSGIMSVIETVQAKFIDVDKGMDGITNNIINNFKSVLLDISNEKDAVIKNSKEIMDSIQNITNNLVLERDKLTSSITEIQDVANSSVSVIKLSANEIANTSSLIKNNANEINSVINTSNTNLDNQAKIIVKVVDEVKNRLDSKIDDLTSVAKSVSLNGRLGEMSIKTEEKMLITISNELINKISDINKQMSVTANVVNEIINNLNSKFNNINENMLQKTSQSTKLLNDSIEKNISTYNEFYNKSNVLKNDTDKITGELKLLFNTIRQETLNLNNTTNNTKDLLNNISMNMATASKKIPEIINNVKTMDNVVMTTSKNVDMGINSINDKSAAVLNTLNNIDSQFAKFVNDKKSEMEFLSENSISSITKVAGYMNNLSNEIKMLINEFNNIYGKVKNKSDV